MIVSPIVQILKVNCVPLFSFCIFEPRAEKKGSSGNGRFHDDRNQVSLVFYSLRSHIAVTAASGYGFLRQGPGAA